MKTADSAYVLHALRSMTGARIMGINQPHLERVIELEFAASDEIGTSGLQAYYRGDDRKRSNLILCGRMAELLIACARWTRKCPRQDRYFRACFTGPAAPEQAGAFCCDRGRFPAPEDTHGK